MQPLEFLQVRVCIGVDVVTREDGPQAEPLRGEETFARAHFAGDHLTRHREAMKYLRRIRDAECADGRLIQVGLQLHVAEERRVAVVVEPMSATKIDYEGHWDAAGERAIWKFDL